MELPVLLNHDASRILSKKERVELEAKMCAVELALGGVAFVGDGVAIPVTE